MKAILVSCAMTLALAVSLYQGDAEAWQCVNYGQFVCAGYYGSVDNCNADYGGGCFESAACTTCCVSNICPY